MHELGHVVGLDHDDAAAYPFMAATLSPMTHRPGQADPDSTEAEHGG